MSIIKYAGKFIPVVAALLISNTTFAQQEEANSVASDSVIVTATQSKKGPKIKGAVVDGASGKPLSGVNVSVRNYAATISDDKGEFEINVPSYRSVIDFSLEGYHSKDIAIRERKSIKVSLFENTSYSNFANVILPNYTGSQNRVPASVSSLNLSSTLSGNETLDSYLQGKVAGLNVIRRSGTPGVGANLMLRGWNSLYASNQPLVVVDGMIYDIQSYGQSLIGGHFYNSFQEIDLRDIQNVSVIKDASISGIYGTKASNGVIYITTNHAHELATKIDFTASSGFNIRPATFQMLNRGEYQVYLAELLKSKGGMSDASIANSVFLTDNTLVSNYYNYNANNTNWQDDVYRNSMSQNYHLKITGGDNIAKYALSMGYLKNNSVTQKTDLSRYNTRFNADLNLSKRLTANSNLAFTYGEQSLADQGLSPRTNPIFTSLVKAPIFSPNYRDSIGQSSPTLSEVDPFGVSNPVALINNAYNSSKVYRFFGSINFNYSLSKDLLLNNVIGLTFDKTKENMFVPKKGVLADTLYNAIAKSTAGAQVSRLFTLYNDTRLTYSKHINNDHSLTGIVGVIYQTNKSEADIAYGYNSATDYLVSVGYGAASLRDLGGQRGAWNWLNNYYSANYAFRQKYFASLALSISASSRFGDSISNAMRINEVNYAVMPSVNVGWLVSSENFMNKFSSVDLLKLRASYGVVGNDDIGNYTRKMSYTSQNILGIEGLVRANIANPYIQWEQTKKFNVGFDASLYNERLSFSLDYYNNRSSNILTYRYLGAINGFSSVPENSASLTNSGFDLAMGARLINSKVKWNLELTASTSNSKLNKLTNGSIINSYPGTGATFISTEGFAANRYYGFKTKGVYATSEQAQAEGLSVIDSRGRQLQFGAGDVRFIDLDGNRVIDDNDRTVIGNPNPDLFGSITNHLKYKRWSFDAMFTYSLGNDVFNYTRSQLESVSSYYNQTPAVLGRWRTEGQITDVPKVNYGDPLGNSRFSDRWIEDGSYVRLRSCSIFYDIPTTKQKVFKNARVFLSGHNLITFTKYLGTDPEFSSTNSMFSQGVDSTLEPIYKSVELGFKVGL